MTHSDIRQRPRFLRTDLHMHSTYSDGHATVDQLIQRAEDIGFTFTISDHYSDSPIHTLKTDDELGAYLDELENHPQLYRAVEMDLGNMLPMSPQNLSRLDYRIGSMHSVDDEHGNQIIVAGRDEPDGGWEHYMERYIESFCRDVLAGKVQMIGHPTHVPDVRSGMHEKLWTAPRRRQILDAVVRSGVGLEISTRYSMPSPVFMQEALEAGAKFAVGSDSHWLDKTAEISLVHKYIDTYSIDESRFFLPDRIIAPPALMA